MLRAVVHRMKRFCQSSIREPHQYSPVHQPRIHRRTQQQHQEILCKAVHSSLAAREISDVVVVGRPGSDASKPEPPHVRAAIFDTARPVLVVPPNWEPRPIGHAHAFFIGRR